MTATAPRVGVVDRLRQDGRIGEVLEDLLGFRVDRTKTTAARCLNPAAHRNGDANPSMIVEPTAAGVRCAVCGLSEGLLALAVRAGHGPTTADAAAWIEATYFGDAHVNGRGASGRNGQAVGPASAKDVVFPPHPEIAAALNWTTVERHGRSVLAKPVFDERFAQCATKIRGARGKDGKLLAYLEEFGGRREPGLVGDVPELETVEPGTFVVLAAGGTDLLELKHAAEREGVLLRVVSHSNGEGAALDERASLFAGLRVGVVYDTDHAGRKGAAARVQELRAAGALAVADVELPFNEAQRRDGCKDLRDWLTRCSGSARGLLGVVERTIGPARVRTATQMIEDYRAGRIVRRLVLVEGLLRAKDIMFIFGAAGLGKSQLALALLVCLAAGPAAVSHVLADPRTPLWMLAADRALKVVLISAEDDDADVVVRLMAYLAARKLPTQLDNLIVVTPNEDERNLLLGAGRAFLDKIVKEHRPDVVAIDNLTNVLAGLDKLDEAAVSAWINAVPRHLRDEYGTAVILLAHANKGGGKDDGRAALDRLFGSMAFGACADGAVMLDRVPDEPNQRWIVHAKARGFAPFPTIKTESARGDCVFPIVSVDGVAAGTASLKVSSDEIVDALRVLAPDGHDVNTKQARTQVNAARATRGIGDDVGRTAWDTAVSKLAKMPNARFIFTPAPTRGVSATLRLLPRDGHFGDAK